MECFDKKCAFYYLLIFYSVLRICWRFLILYLLTYDLINHLQPSVIDTLNHTIVSHINNYSTVTISLSSYLLLFEIFVTTSTLYSKGYTRLINFSILLSMSVLTFLSNFIIYFNSYNSLSLTILLIEPVIIFNSIVLTVYSKININKNKKILPTSANTTAANTTATNHINIITN